MPTRREFLGRGAVAAGALSAPALTGLLVRDQARGASAASVAASPAARAAQDKPAPKFKVSLAAWSVHRMFHSGKIAQIDLPALARKEFNIEGLELVNTFFPSPHYEYCKDLRKRAEDNGVRILLIMCDAEGDMCHADKAERQRAVRNHRKWVDVASLLGCHSVRCNSGEAKAGDADAIARCVESFRELVDYAAPDNLNIIIENHGGLSSDADSLVKVMQGVNNPRFGTLPDFGNFPDSVDRYESVRKMMPYAKAVSAKCYAFDAEGNETKIDYAKMMKVVLDSGYNRYLGIEYEGPNEDEFAGVRACQKLLARFQ